MKTKIYLVMFILVITSLIFLIAVVNAIPENDNAFENVASEHSPVFEFTSDGQLIRRVDFIHYSNGQIKLAKSSPEDCYAFIAGEIKIKWPSTISYVINPTNSGLDYTFVNSAISTSAETWDDATTTSELFANYGTDTSAKYGKRRDGKNAIVFGRYSGSRNVIAVTSVWYSIISGNIVEFDILFNTRFKWGDCLGTETCYSNKVMDLQNIATHELGHGVGLADIYSSSCSAVTMYGYSYYGETQKRILETPDITGLQTLY